MDRQECLSYLFKLYGDELRNADFLHGDAIEGTGHFHGPLVMSNDNELGVRRHLDRKSVV